MNKIDEKKVNDIIHSIGLNNNLTDEQVRQIIESQFRFTCEQIRKLDFEDIDDEEIENLKKNFYYKYFGKLFTDINIIKRYKNKRNYIKLKKENGRNEKLDMERSS